MSEYKGPERRGKSPSRRRVLDLKYADTTRPFGLSRLERESVYAGRSRLMNSERIANSTANPYVTRQTGLGPHGIVEIKESVIARDRRVEGAGRRKGDLSRALDTGENVTLDVNKSPKSAFKGLGKVAKKAAKHGGKLGLAISAASSVYDMVNKNKN